jgi:hypothetical protein
MAWPKRSSKASGSPLTTANRAAWPCCCPLEWDDLMVSPTYMQALDWLP